jgi:hypothetical protein
MGVVTSCSFELSMIRVVDKPWFLLKRCGVEKYYGSSVKTVTNFIT